ncbi:MAG TPA: AAA family ATPase, partial [Chitinophagaceae bacterium]|nr:AAA family ATPase [Chitinophagaceae bacterium]
MENINTGNILESLCNDAAGNSTGFDDYKTTFTATELLTLKLTAIPCLFGNIIPSSGIWTMVGSSDTGKSMLLRQLAIATAKGQPFLNWPNYAQHKKVIFISTEDDATSTSYLLGRQTQDTGGMDNIRFFFETTDIPEYLVAQLNAQPADLVIIDAWSDVFGKDLKDSALIRKTLNVYKAIAAKYLCSIGFLHHTGKRTERLEPSKNNILSGQGFEAAMRLVIELRADAVTNSLRHLCVVKGNYLGDEFKRSSYVLHFNADNFLFSDTGERTPFEQLGASAAPAAGEQKKKSIRFEDMEDGMHRQLLTKAFENDAAVGYAGLVNALAKVYNNSTGESYGRDKA